MQVIMADSFVIVSSECIAVAHSHLVLFVYFHYSKCLCRAGVHWMFCGGGGSAEWEESLGFLS